MEKKYQETLDYLHKEAAKASPHSQHEANLLTLIDVFEELINKNQELKELVDSLNKEQILGVERIFNLEMENEKSKKAIEILKDSLHLRIDFYDYDYDYKFVVTVGGLFEHISSEEYELLKEVLSND